MKVRDTSQGRMYAVSSEIGCTAINGAMAVDIPAGGQSVILALDKKLIIDGDDNAKFVEVRWGTNAAVGSRPAPSWIGDVVDGIVSIVGADKFDVTYIPAENKLYLVFSLDTTSAQIEEVKSLCARVLPSNVVTEMEWVDGLPMTYTRLEYLESTGTQWIDTGIKLSNESEVKCEYVINQNENINAVFGARDDYALNSYCLYSPNSGGRISLVYGVNGKSNSLVIPSVNEKYVATTYNGILTINGKSTNQTESDSFVTAYSCFLFAVNTKGSHTANPKLQGRIYSFSISRNSRSQLNFIPCLDRTGRPCMFDTVTRTAFYNQATTGSDFIAGMTWEQVRELRLPATGGKLTLSLPYEASIDGIAQAALEQARANGWELTLQYDEAELPAGYSKLDFLESTGTQYIDTGAKLTNESEVTCEFMETDKAPNTSAIYGNETDKNARFSAFLKVGTSGTISRWDFSSEMVFYPNPLEMLTKYKSVHNATGVTLNDKEIVAFSPSDSFETGNLGLFTHNTITGGYYAIARIYTFNISRSNSLQLAYIPCLDPEGVPCMYDLASHQPFRNNGTGQFIAGMTLEQVRGLSLPSGGGQLTLALPYEASIDKLAQDALEQARSNGWQLTLQYAESDVPAGYRKLDFLESTGTQKLNITTNSSYIKALVDIQYMQIELDQYQGFVTSASFFGTNANGHWLGSTGAPVTKATTDRIIITNTFNRGAVDIDYGELRLKTLTTSVEECPQFCLFGRGTNYSYCRIHSVKLSVEPDVVHDLIPCIAPDGKLGMYNSLNGTLQENDGTGSFIAGLATVDDVRNLWLPETNGELTVSVPADTPDSAVDQLRANNPTWQIAIQFRTDNEN